MKFLFCINGFFILVAITNGATERDNNNEVKLLEKLFPSSYKPIYKIPRPIKNEKDTMIVTIQFTPVQILHVDERNQNIRISIWLSVFWKDEFLNWNPDDFGGLKYLTILSDVIWLPDIGMEHSLNDAVDLSQGWPWKLSLRHDGIIKWVPGITPHVSCIYDMFRFPFDRQKCFLKFTSFTYFTERLRFNDSKETITYDTYKPHGAWDLRITAEVRNQTFKDLIGGVDDTFSVYMVTLHLKRKATFFVINILFPCILVSILVVMVFYLPPESFDKVPLGITVLLSYIVFQLTIADIMPQTSDTIPVLTFYTSFLMFLSTASVAMCVTLSHLNSYQGTTRPPKCCRRIIKRFMSDQDRQGEENLPFKSINENEENKNVSENKTLEDKKNMSVEEWKMLAYLVNRLFLILYAIVTVLLLALTLIIAMGGE